MNKKKNIYWRRRVNLSATFFAVLLMLGACKKEVTEIGGDLQNENLNVQFIDTFTVVTYSDQLESTERRSDETSVSLLGAYNDPIFGGVNCGIVTQITPSTSTQSFPSLTYFVMDSVVLSLSYTSIKYYANLDDISVQVHEIDDALERNDQKYYSYENPTLIGDNLVLPSVTSLSPDIVANQIVGTDTLSAHLRIHLDTAVGRDLIADAHASLLGDNFKSTTFKGLYIHADVDDAMPGYGIPTGSGTVLYFALESPLSKVTLYYHSLSGDYDRYDFDINSNCARYNTIDFKREGTNVENAIVDKLVGEDAFYIQGSAIRGVVEFPYLKDFYKNDAGEDDPKIINKAKLILPIQDFQTDPFDPATYMFMYRGINLEESSFLKGYGLGSGASYNESKKEFSFDITREVQAILNGEVEESSYGLYFSGFYGSSVERIILNGSKSLLKNRPKLEITYTEY